jgi:hypothetical protein
MNAAEHSRAHRTGENLIASRDSCAVTSTLAIALLLSALSSGPTPALVVLAPDARIAEPFVAALRTRMPSVRVVVGSQSGPDDLQVVVTAGAASRTLVVLRNAKVVLRRELEAEAGSETSYVVCAAVIERFLQEIAWAGMPEPIDRAALRLRPPQDPQEPPPHIEPLPAPTSRADFSVGLGVQGAAGISPGDWRIGPALDLGLRTEHAWTSLRAQLYFPTSTSVNGWRDGIGDLRQTPAAIAALGGLCTGGWPSFCGGAQIGWRATWVSASGDLVYSAQTVRSDALLAGMFGMVSATLPHRFEVRALLSAAGFVGDKAFSIEGAKPLDGPPAFEVGLCLELARQVP